MSISLRLVLPLVALVGVLQAAPNADAQRRVRGRQGPAVARPIAQARPATRVRPTATLRTEGLGKHSATTQKSLEGVLKSSGSKYFTREVNGAKRLIANVSGQEALNSVAKAMGKDSNVIQILHIGKSSIQHTMAIFDGELVHTQHVSGTQNWRLRNWGDTLRNSNTKLYSAFIALSPKEAAKLRTTLSQAKKDQGPEQQAGANWANGKLKNTSLGGCRSFDCATTWTDMPLGEKGETLGQIVGFGNSYSRHPRTLQKNLETGGNERIIGVAVYGPRIDSFGAKPDKAVVEF